MVNFGFRRGGPVPENVEVAALVRLLDVLREDRAVAARVVRRSRLPRLAPPRKLLFAHLELESPRLDVELDEISILHQRERTADKGLRRHVQHARAVRSPA